MESKMDIRPSPIAGTWYDGNASQLAKKVDDTFTQAALPEIEGEILGLIVPHAGHRYSGRTAGVAFSAIRGKKWGRVAILSPMHSFHPAPLLTTAHDAYATPLGVVNVDRDGMESLAVILDKTYGLPLYTIAKDREHSLEIELPFLQRALPDGFSLLPLMVRAQEAEISRIVGTALAELLKNSPALLVASTDLSHFYPLEVAEKLDAEMLHRFASLEPESLFEAERSGAGFACGHAAVAAVLWAAKALGANKVQILDHSTSAEETGDSSSVVGYGSAVILKA